MTLILFTIATLSASGEEPSRSDEEPFMLTRLKSPPDSLTETFYQITTSGMVNIGGELIQKISIQTENGKSHGYIDVFYKNITSETVSPKYTIRLYNPYGILMGGAQVPLNEKTPETKLRPRAEETTSLMPRITKLDSLFRHTNFKAYPSDFFSISWLSISDSNDKKVEQANTKPTATQPDTKSEITDASKSESK
jgi:hypothetical protein